MTGLPIPCCMLGYVAANISLIFCRWRLSHPLHLRSVPKRCSRLKFKLPLFQFLLFPLQTRMALELRADLNNENQDLKAERPITSKRSTIILVDRRSQRRKQTHVESLSSTVPTLMVSGLDSGSIIQK